MKLHRFILDIKLAKGQVVVDDADVVRQMSAVLKLKVGEAVVLSDGQGNDAKGEIIKLDKRQVAIDLDAPRVCHNEPVRNVTLFCAILKRENFEWVVQKATEIGVAKIVPIITERTVKQALKMERLRSIAKEAAEQSGRCRVPDIAEPTKLSEALVSSKNQSTYFFHTSPASVSDLPTFRPSDNMLSIYVGPEGGWTDNEVRLAKDFGCKTASLGKLVLRGETAAVCASFWAVGVGSSWVPEIGHQGVVGL